MARYPIQQAARIIADGIPVGPRVHPCVCGQGRHAHGGAQSTGACKDSGCSKYRPDTAWELAYKALDAQATSLGHSLRAYDRLERDARRKAHPRSEGEWSIGPSDAGTCRKQIEYRNQPPEGFIPDPVDNREARMGSIIHKEAVRELALLYPWRLHEREVRVAGLDRPSYYDEYDPVIAQVHDVKTAGDWRWNQVDDHGPESDVWQQVMLYGLALEEDGHEVRTVKITYLKRDNGHDQEFIRDYDREFAIAARDELIAVATALDLGESLPRDRSGPTTDALCRRCFARTDCWNLIQADAVGRSGESYTILGSDPDTKQLAWAAEQAVLARDTRTAAKAAEDEAKALLDGIEPGRYGDYQGVETVQKSSGNDYKSYADMLAEAMRLPDGARPDPEDIPIPKRPGNTYMTWKRMSKAVLEKEARARGEKPGLDGAA